MEVDSETSESKPAAFGNTVSYACLACSLDDFVNVDRYLWVMEDKGNGRAKSTCRMNDPSPRSVPTDPIQTLRSLPPPIYSSVSFLPFHFNRPSPRSTDIDFYRRCQVTRCRLNRRASIFRFLSQETRPASMAMLTIEPTLRCTLSDLVRGLGRDTLVCRCNGAECEGGANTPPPRRNQGVRPQAGKGAWIAKREKRRRSTWDTNGCRGSGAVVIS
jgi:hypothetical protein